MMSLTLLSKRLGQVSLSQHHVAKAFVVTSPSLTVRTFAGKVVNKKKENQQRKRKPKPQADENLQHGEWLKFQQSISIDGFQTGQTTTLQSGLGQKRRGGKQVLKRIANKAQKAAVTGKDAILKHATADRAAQVGGGMYPPLRYSQEETDRLLAEAYGSIPERAGKRGTRNLQRQSNRWHAVRKARKISKKNYGIKTHTRRMEARSNLVRDVKEVKKAAPALREREAAYQQHVLQRWVEFMIVNPKDGADSEAREKDNA